MNSIIVTVTDFKKRFFYDIEIPITIALDKLKNDIVEVINGCNPEHNINALSIELFNNRLGIKLNSENTLEDIGIWNGDYITILEV